MLKCECCPKPQRHKHLQVEWVFSECSPKHDLPLQFVSNPPWIPTRCIDTCSCRTEVGRPHWRLKTSTRPIILSASTSGGRSSAGSRWEAVRTTGRWSGAARRSAELLEFHTPNPTHPVVLSYLGRNLIKLAWNFKSSHQIFVFVFLLSFSRGKSQKLSSFGALQETSQKVQTVAACIWLMLQSPNTFGLWWLCEVL